MSLLGIDIGTTGCKSAAYTTDGQLIAVSYEEYNFVSEKPGYAELDTFEVLNKIKKTIKEVALKTTTDPIKALSTSSLGEAFVPVTSSKEILYNSILGLDSRGEEFANSFFNEINEPEFFRINGNIPGVYYSMPKILWLKKYEPEVYNRADYFLLWADFVCFILGGKPVTNYSLASRTLLFDINKSGWAEQFFRMLDLDIIKFAPVIQSGVGIGTVTKEMCEELFLPEGVEIISGGHDQCCAALGSGISDSNTAMYGMGTFICVVPVFPDIPDHNKMLQYKLNIEHHVIPDLFVTFLYNLTGGALVKWYRDTFTANISEHAKDKDKPAYDFLFKEIPDKISDIIVIPRFGPTGAPDFFSKSTGCISYLSFEHTRGDILKAMVEGMTFHFKANLPIIEKQGIKIESLVVTGGGAASDIWLQITADILNKPLIKNKVKEAGTLGAAILGGIGSKVFSSVDEGVNLMVHTDVKFYPNPSKAAAYEEKFKEYIKLYSYFTEDKCNR
jgi:xylulokinase